MENEYVWVVAFDKKTGERVGFTRCHRNNAKFYIEDYKYHGHDAEIFTGEDVDEMIELEKNES